MVKYLLKKSYHVKDLKNVKFNSLWGYNGVFTTIRIYYKNTVKISFSAISCGLTFHQYCLMIRKIIITVHKKLVIFSRAEKNIISFIINCFHSISINLKVMEVLSPSLANNGYAQAHAPASAPAPAIPALPALPARLALLPTPFPSAPVHPNHSSTQAPPTLHMLLLACLPAPRSLPSNMGRPSTASCPSRHSCTPTSTRVLTFPLSHALSH